MLAHAARLTASYSNRLVSCVLRNVHGRRFPSILPDFRVPVFSSASAPPLALPMAPAGVADGTTIPVDVDSAQRGRIEERISEVRMTTPLPIGAAEGTAIPAVSALLGLIDERVSQIRSEMTSTIARISELILAKDVGSELTFRTVRLDQLTRVMFDTVALRDQTKARIQAELETTAAGKKQDTEEAQEKARIETETTKQIEELAEMAEKQAVYTMPRQPFEFECQTEGDDIDQSSMMVAQSIPNSNIVGPMYLSEQVHRDLVDFVSSPRPEETLVVLGPPKSSKTTVLFEVLPKMVTAHPGRLDPAFVRLALSLDDTPLRAAKKIWHALARAARAFDVYDVDVRADATFDDARLEIPILIRDLAPRFEKKAKRQLWLLIDEVSAPMLRAKSKEAALGFAYLLKEMIAAAGTRVRIGLTGSSMITFPNFVRVMRPNSFQMFTTNKHVLLGHALTPQWATRIADDLTSAIIEHHSSSLSSPDLTSDMVLDSIRQQKNKLNLRPAIIQQLITKFHARKSLPKSIETKLSRAMEGIVSKMDQETAFDFTHALESLSYSVKFLQTFRLLALGETSGSELKKRLALDEAKLLALQCGLDDLEDVALPVLLPPYAHLCTKLLVLNDGNIAVNSALFLGYRAELLAPLLHDAVMILCTESLKYFTDADKNLISDTVVRVLFEHGICAKDADGKKIPVRSVFDHRLLKELHRTSSDPDKYKSELSAYKAWSLGGCHGVPPSTKYPVGLQVQQELRNLHFHDPPTSENNFLLNGWHIDCLHGLAQKLRECLPSTSAPIDFSDPSFPVFKAKV